VVGLSIPKLAKVANARAFVVILTHVRIQSKQHKSWIPAYARMTNGGSFVVDSNHGVDTGATLPRLEIIHRQE
jgi:hypothetical protein